MIIRSEKKGNYTILPNALLLDDTISDKARGLLVRLLSRPDNWNVNVGHLVKTGKAGHVAVRSALKELEDAGYIRRDVHRSSAGRIIGVEYIVGDHLVDADEMVNHIPDVTKMVDAMEDHTEEILVMDTHIKETSIKATAPITNTVIKQILKETTTTAPPSSSSNLEILNLIPEHHRTPLVVTFVNKAVVDYPENQVKSAVAYAAGNVRGGSMQFRAYLDKTLKNKWADGWEPETAMGSRIDKDATRNWFGTLSDDTLKFMSGNLWAIEELNRRKCARA